jgi:hypothetical protein
LAKRTAGTRPLEGLTMTTLMKYIAFAFLVLGLTACSRVSQSPPYLRHLECSVNGKVIMRSESVEQIIMVEDTYTFYQKEYDNHVAGRYRQRMGEYCQVLRSQVETEQ